jgi:hypothetical protein
VSNKVEEVGVMFAHEKWLSSSGAEFPLSFALLYRAVRGPRNQVLVRRVRTMPVLVTGRIAN